MPTIRVTPDQAAALEAMARERGGSVNGQPSQAPRKRASKVFVQPGIAVAPGRLTIIVPTETKSEANARDHWGKVKRTKSAKGILFSFMQAHHGSLTPFVGMLADHGALRVTLTRLGNRELDDDNLRSSLKATRDTVAAMLLVDDRDPRVHWLYGAEPGGEIGVKVEIERI